jgi:hypothetical protein
MREVLEDFKKWCSGSSPLQLQVQLEQTEKALVSHKDKNPNFHMIPVWEAAKTCLTDCITNYPKSL